ncbi:MAG: hypothetical protein ABI564_07045 [Ideonella sp.]
MPKQAAETPIPNPVRPTPEQLRAALERADPATRKKLLRLFAGGRAVDQSDGQPSVATGQARRLTMNLHRAQPQTASKRTDAERANASPSQRPPNAASISAGETLLKIDANTDLLDAAAAPLSAEQRKAALQSQLAATQSQQSQSSETAPAAHKVLFPAYNPLEHGDDVRRPTRRSEAPVEGHFPAPRQPTQARYQHADGRPMDEEETRVEAVLQEQRCEQTLAVLARDGVNGLLLSPRDLDAAVENGTLDEPTATLLWKTWSALRPVIHVIDDEPAASTHDSSGSSPDSTEEEPKRIELAPPDPAIKPDATQDREPSAIADDTLPRSAEPVPAPTEKPIQTNEAGSIAEPARPPASMALDEPVEEQPQPKSMGRADGAATHRDDRPESLRKSHSRIWLRNALRGLAALCVLYTGTQLSAWAWLRWGQWLVG